MWGLCVCVCVCGFVYKEMLVVVIYGAWKGKKCLGVISLWECCWNGWMDGGMMAGGGVGGECFVDTTVAKTNQ